MPPRPERPAPLAWQVFRGSDAIRQGLLTRHQLRGASWVRLLHDVYADARLDRDHRLACQAALLRLPPGTVVAGPSAAYLHGITHAASFTDDVHVLVPRTIRADSHRGIRVHSASLAPVPAGFRQARRHPSLGPTAEADVPGATPPGSHVTVVPPDGRGAAIATGSAATLATPGVGTAIVATPGGGGANVATAARSGGHEGSARLFAAQPSLTGSTRSGTSRILRSDPTAAAWETAVWLEPTRAVGIVDALLGQGLTDRGALAEIAASRADRPAGRRASWVFDLADPAAQSPPESHLRVRLVLAGLPRPVAQHPVRLASGLVVHPDLSWPEYRVAVEYDGHWHADADQLHADRRRLNHLVAAGWLVLHVTSRSLHRDFPAVARGVRSALVARGWRR